MKREHLINTILSAVFPSGSIPLTSAFKMPRILTLVDELVDEVGTDDSAAEPAPPLRASAPATPAEVSADGIDWDNEPRLGVMSDEKLAYELGVSRKTVTRARKQRGIRSSTDASGVGVRKGIDWDNEPRLGVVGDTVLAKELGVTAVTVLTARRKRGLASPVPPSGRKPEAAPPPAANTSKAPSKLPKAIDWDAEPQLGHVVDSVLATKYGVTAQAVFIARKKRGIPAWTPKDELTTEPTPSNDVPSAPPPPLKPDTPVEPKPSTFPKTFADRQRERDLIEDHIKTKGVTKVETRYVEPDSIPANPKGRGGLV